MLKSHSPLFKQQGDELPDYQFDPIAYEREQDARPDEQLLYNVSSQWARALLDEARQNVAVLDLCCGTGLSIRQVASHPNIRRAVGVDNCEPYLRFAANRFKDNERLQLVEADAVAGDIPEDRWAVVMMVSAYHHIEDHRKIAFLNRVRQLLGSDGYAIVGENVLPDYKTGDKNSYCAAVRTFYDQVERDVLAQEKEIDPQILLTIERVAKYGFDGEYEYKVKYDIMKNHFEVCGLKVVREQRVWPKAPIAESGGNYVIMLRGMTRDELRARELRPFAGG